jgi:RND family efflux transporter MFP subunit
MTTISVSHQQAARINRCTDRLPVGGKSRLVAFLIWLLGVILAAGCNQTANPARDQKPIEVVVTTPTSGEVIDYQDFTGRLDAITVEIRARVTGFIMEAPFKEGDLVHQGDLLFQIDRRPYQATLNQAEANVKLAQADRNLQQKNTQRARTLVGSNSIAREDFDTVMATAEKSAATVGAAQAARDLAQLNLDYTKVTAPMTGHISRRLVDPGNLINADTTILTTMVADQSLYAYFDVDERSYLNLVGKSKSGENSWVKELRFPVLMRMANEEEFSRTGVVTFIDNRVSATSGTIRMRAEFENSNGILKPGLFVRIRLPIGIPYTAVLIPDEALMSDQGRKYVYVVNGKSEVEYRSVDLGQEIQGLRVIKNNLNLGERVIISGMQRVRQKALVEIKEEKAPPKAPESPLGRLVSLNPHNKRGDDAKGGQ